MKDKRNITEDIALAIQKLEIFSDALVKIKLTPLQKTIHLAKSFLKKAFSEKKTSKSDIQEVIETIQKNFLFIEKLKKGNVAEKALAEASINAVKRYNETLQKTQKKMGRIHQRISQFMYKRWGFSAESEKKPINFPFEASVEFTYCQNQKETDKVSQTAISFIQGNEFVLQEEADAFRMKAMSLLKEQGFTPMGNEVRNAPIIAALHSEDLKKILMSQIVKSFPGETFAFKGVFQRNCGAFFKSVPLFGSFEILTHSKQTGFPHPMQYTGFALADCMIPPCPLKQELLTNFISLFKLKYQIAKELLPKGNLITKAKEILKFKKQVFEENKVLLLEKHIALYVAMFGERVKNEIQPFFNSLKTLPSCYHHFTEIQETLIQRFVVSPFEKLKEEFLEEKNEALYSKVEKIRGLTACAILEKEQTEAFNFLKSQNSKESQFLSCIGPLIGKTANAILLQNISETIGFSPVPLNNEEQKMQVALYKQLIAFQKELNENCTKELIQSNFLNEMDSDIQLFNFKSLENYQGFSKKIVKELESYYNFSLVSDIVV